MAAVKRRREPLLDAAPCERRRRDGDNAADSARSCETTWPPLDLSLLDEAISALPEEGRIASSLLRKAVEHHASAEWQSVASHAREAERIAWSALHTGHWTRVPTSWRAVYMAAAYYTAAGEFLAASASPDQQDAGIHPERAALGALRTVDLGLMLGDHTFRQDLLRAAETLEAQRSSSSHEGELASSKEENTAHEARSTVVVPVPSRRPLSGTLPSLPVLALPSLPFFYNECMLAARPAVLSHVIDSWPACGERSWSNLGYLKAVAGDRTVPVELGAHYADPQFDEQLMTLRTFIEEFIEQPPANGHTGYLAQHQLFEHLPRLRRDIQIPDYCALSLEDAGSEVDEAVASDEPHRGLQDERSRRSTGSDAVRINAWFGPAGTLSPLHHDRYHNLLAQVTGSKYVRLYEPTQKNEECLYPHLSGPHKITSQIVDPDKVDASEFPLFHQAAYVDLQLNAKDVLYIPPHWWHFVEASETSFSVSFWWL
mmetsp:Transcript_13371/g.31835  ORF Transcript_13371/g.31835 Transcript_13371/m.31835 type:complete len:486 (-) Transcript_13371:95-1552(-)